jgi:hypothetical protein
MMKTQQALEEITARYPTLAAAEAALHELQGVAIPYPDIHMGAQAGHDCPHAGDGARPATCWSLTVMLDSAASAQADSILLKHQPAAIGREPAPQHGRGETDQGALAWRHYVFEAPAATDWVGDRAGTTGTTGVINSGVFAEGALAEGNPPTRDLPRSQRRPAPRR